MEKSLQELAETLGGRLIGDPLVMISGLSTLDAAKEGQITFLANPKYANKVATTGASAVVVGSEGLALGRNAIVVDNPYLAFAKLLTAFTNRPRIPKGIMKGVHIGTDCVIGEDPSIHPGTVIGDRVTIGERVTLHANVTLYDGVVLGDDVTLHAGVCVREGCRIGNRVRVHNNSTIGSDGFGYAPDGDSWFKIPQVGIVVIEDDVEIGANAAVDRAALEVTLIGRGTKIDNLVQVAHNCQVGENCILVAQVGIAGSVKIGKHVTLGGQAAVGDHITVGDNTMISGQSGVMGNVGPGEILSGTPAIPHMARMRSAAVFPRLPEMRKTIARLDKRMAKVEEELKIHPMD